MNRWPNINRARLIRYNLIFGLVWLSLAVLYAILELAGVEGTPDRFDWFPVLSSGGLGVLLLLGVWSMRRDQAREDAAVDRKSRR